MARRANVRPTACATEYFPQRHSGIPSVNFSHIQLAVPIFHYFSPQNDPAPGIVTIYQSRQHFLNSSSAGRNSSLVSRILGRDFWGRIASLEVVNEKCLQLFCVLINDVYLTVQWKPLTPCRCTPQRGLQRRPARFGLFFQTFDDDFVVHVEHDLPALGFKVKNGLHQDITSDGLDDVFANLSAVERDVFAVDDAVTLRHEFCFLSVLVEVANSPRLRG